MDMKILTISDIVVPELTENIDDNPFSDVDLVLSCGDLPPEYLAAILHKMNAPVYYVRGNHDIRYENRPPMGCIDLHGRIVRFKGLKLMGLEGSRWYNGGPVQYREHQMRNIIWRLMPRIFFARGVDIVVTHAPPRHIHDAEDRCHKGFKSFMSLIRRYNPSYFIHGHIHAVFNDPAQRVTIVGSTRVINAFGYNILELNDEYPA